MRLSSFSDSTPRVARNHWAMQLISIIWRSSASQSLVVALGFGADDGERDLKGKWEDSIKTHKSEIRYRKSCKMHSDLPMKFNTGVQAPSIDRSRFHGI